MSFVQLLPVSVFHTTMMRSRYFASAAVKGKRAAYNRWGMKAVMDMLRTHSSGQLLGIPGVLNL